MERRKSLGAVIILALGLLALAGANERMEAAEDGRLVIRYSPTLGMNVTLFMRIDGQAAGGISRNHIYKRDLSPGIHRITVRNNGRLFDEFHMTLNVRPGQTYSFLAKHPPEQLVLEPVGSSSH